MATVPLQTTDTASSPPQAVAAKRRISLPSIDLSVAQIMSLVAALMLPAGIVVVLLGWWGAAHTPFVFEQIPYLISGGLLGIGLLMAGGLLYLGSWLARLAEQQRKEGEELRGVIVALRNEIERLPSAMGSTSPGATAVGTFVATKTGTMFHRPDCSVVAERPDLRQVGADDGLTPCKICQPTAEV